MVSAPHPSQVKAGKIAARILDEVCGEVKPGMKVASICSRVESMTVELGARPAFPCNVSINQVAAHYTSPRRDNSLIPDFGLVKVDMGAHVDGYLVDTARTVDIDGSLEGFVTATDDALSEAIKLMRPDMSVGEIGRKIEEVIGAYGLRPVRELTGHSLDRYKLHGGKQIPNFGSRDSTKIEAGECFAVEPFATSGTHVGDSKAVYIFSNTGVDRPLSGVTEKLRIHLRKRYGPLPFASRWIGTEEKSIDVVAELEKLLKAKAIHGYPVLVEKTGRPVSQTEDTVFVSEDGPVVLTRSG